MSVPGGFFGFLDFVGYFAGTLFLGGQQESSRGWGGFRGAGQRYSEILLYQMMIEEIIARRRVPSGRELLAQATVDGLERRAGDESFFRNSQAVKEASFSVLFCEL